jgi:hypothetical protein
MRLDGLTPPLIVAGVTMALIGWRAISTRGKGKKALGQIDLVIVCLVIATAAFLEWRMGRPLTYRHGPVRLWSGNIKSDQNSQQISDPYTFTHVVHGAAFYGLTRLAMPPATLGLRAIAALAIESAWESYENTDTVVERYRRTTISLGYYGDSLINSIFDILACAAGFFLTSRLPRAATIAWVVAVEVVLAFWIRDNLTLNVLMLIHPFDVIRRWQLGL